MAITSHEVRLSIPSFLLDFPQRSLFYPCQKLRPKRSIFKKKTLFSGLAFVDGFIPFVPAFLAHLLQNFVLTLFICSWANFVRSRSKKIFISKFPKKRIWRCKMTFLRRKNFVYTFLCPIPDALKLLKLLNALKLMNLLKL